MTLPRELRVRDLDLVRNARDAVQAGDVVIGRIALELEADVTLERDPAAPHRRIDGVRGNVDIPDQILQGRPADLVIVASIGPGQIHLQAVDDVVDALDAAGILLRTRVAERTARPYLAA